jgi:hypothetical protein
MARWKEFVIALEANFDNSMLLSDLQQYYEDAMEDEDYKSAGKFKKLIDEKIQSDEIEETQYMNEPCFVDLDEVSAFYESEFEDGTKFVRLCLKGGETIPVTITIEEFKHIFFNA